MTSYILTYGKIAMWEHLEFLKWHHARGTKNDFSKDFILLHYIHFYPKRLTYIQYCGQSPQEQFGVKCLAEGHNDMLTAVGLELAILWFKVQRTIPLTHSFPMIELSWLVRWIFNSTVIAAWWPCEKWQLRRKSGGSIHCKYMQSLIRRKFSWMPK